MAFHDLLIDCDLYVERQWISEDQVSNEIRTRQRPTHFTIAVKLQNIGNVQYLNVLTSLKNLECKRALETREAQPSTVSGFMGATYLFLKREGEYVLVPTFLHIAAFTPLTC